MENPRARGRESAAQALLRRCGRAVIAVHQDAPSGIARAANFHNEQVIKIVEVNLPRAAIQLRREPVVGVDLGRRDAQKPQYQSRRMTMSGHQDVLAAAVVEDLLDDISLRAAPGVLGVRLGIDMRDRLTVALRIAVVDDVDLAHDLARRVGEYRGSIKARFRKFIAAPTGLLSVPHDQHSRFGLAFGADLFSAACPSDA